MVVVPETVAPIPGQGPSGVAGDSSSPGRIAAADSSCDGAVTHAAAGPAPEAVWIVIPAYDEARRIGAVLDRLLDRWPNVVVVDDCSRDETAAEVAARPAARLVRHPINLGQGAALQTGIRYALRQGARYLVTFDADGQHSADDLDRLLAPLVSGTADFALGSRFLGHTVGMPASRRLTLKLAVLFTRFLSGVRLTDAHNGLRGMTRRGAESLSITMNRMEHASQIVEQIHDSGLRYVEVPVVIHYTDDTLAKGQKSSAAIKLAATLIMEKFTQ